MKVDIVYWDDNIGKTIKKLTVDAEPFGIQVGMRAEWQMVVADEDKEVKEGKMVPIRIKSIVIPERAIALPCFFMRHALGIVESLTSIGKPRLVEMERKVTHALFYPIQDGIIHEGELLSVINVFPAAIEEPLPNREAIYRWMERRYSD